MQYAARFVSVDTGAVRVVRFDSDDQEYDPAEWATYCLAADDEYLDDLTEEVSDEERA